MGGLDMYVYKMKEFKPSNTVDFHEEIDFIVENDGTIHKPEEFFHWRNHPNLHGLMEKIYREKGGKENRFNCTPVQLTQEDLDRIGALVIDDELPITEGFNFGLSSDKMKEKDIEFLEKASQALKEGFTIWYDSWW